MHNTSTLKLKQLKGTQMSLILLFTPVLIPCYQQYQIAIAYFCQRFVETQTMKGRVNTEVTFVKWPEKRCQMNANVANVAICWVR